MDKKHRQHYVSQYYLKSWHNDKEQIICRRKGKVFPSDVQNVAQQKDFYRVRYLNFDEIEFLKAIWAKEDKSVFDALMKHVTDCQNLFNIEKSIKDGEEKLIKKYEACDKIPVDIKDSIDEYKEQHDIIINNTEEEFLSEIENETCSWIVTLKHNVNDFFNTVDKYTVFKDVAIHYFRTKAQKQRWVQRMKNVFEQEEFDVGFFKALNIEKANVKIENLTHYFFWSLQTKLAIALKAKDAHITVLKNSTDVPFITSDQPVINMFSDYTGKTGTSGKLLLYYPISPVLAITINDNNSVNIIKASLADVDEYNKAIIAASSEFVFANTDTVFKRY